MQNMPGKDTPFISKLRGGIRVISTVESAAFLIYFIVSYFFFRSWYIFLQCSHVLGIIFSCFAAESDNIGILYSVIAVYLAIFAVDTFSLIIAAIDAQDFCGSSDCLVEFILKYFGIVMMCSLCALCLVQMVVYLSLKTQIYKRDFKRKTY
jgi:hypothetical protein